MTDTSDLFDIVKALSKSEKRYFKLQHARGDNEDAHKYLALFNTLDGMERYDKEALLERLQRKEPPKNFRQAKYYLFNAITKSLNQFHGSKPWPRAYLLNLSARILKQKGLHRQSDALLTRARQITKRHNLTLVDLMILLQQSSLLEFTEKDPDKYLQRVETVTDEIRTQTQALKTFVDYQTIYDRMQALLRVKGEPRTEEELAAFRALFDDPAMSSGEHKSYCNAELFYHQIRRIYHMAAGKIELAIEDCRNFRAVVQRVPLPVKFDYMAMIMLCQFYLDQGDVTAFQLEMNTFTTEIGEVDRTKLEGWDPEMELLLQICWIRARASEGRFDEACALLPPLRDARQTGKGKISLTNAVLHDFINFYALFGNERFDEAFSWLRRICDNKSAEFRSDIYYTAHLLTLIVHYELGNLDTLEYSVRTTRNLLAAGKRLYALEIAMLDLFKALSVSSPHERPGLFRRAHARLEELEGHPLKSRLMSSFDFTAWLEAKIQRRRFADMVVRRQPDSAKAESQPPEKTRQPVRRPAPLHEASSPRPLHQRSLAPQERAVLEDHHVPTQPAGS